MIVSSMFPRRTRVIGVTIVGTSAKPLLITLSSSRTSTALLSGLLARIKAVLRREDRGKNIGVNVNIGKIEVNFSKFEAYEGNKNIALSHREFEVLKYLWEHENQLVNREELMNEVWGIGEMTTTRTVDNFILKLRQTIEEDPSHPKHIITVHGQGYKYIP